MCAAVQDLPALPDHLDTEMKRLRDASHALVEDLARRQQPEAHAGHIKGITADDCKVFVIKMRVCEACCYQQQGHIV